MRWKANVVPRYGLMIKYLAMIMSRRELDDLIRKYVAVKEKALGKKLNVKKRNVVSSL